MDCVLAILEALEAKPIITFTKERFPFHPNSWAMLINMLTVGRPLFTEIAPFRFFNRFIKLSVKVDTFQLVFIFTFYNARVARISKQLHSNCGILSFQYVMSDIPHTDRHLGHHHFRWCQVSISPPVSCLFQFLFHNRTTQP